MVIDIEQVLDVELAKPAIVTTYDYYKTGKLKFDVLSAKYSES